MRCLIHFFDDWWNDFRVAEVKSLFLYFGLCPFTDESILQFHESYLVVDIPSSEVAAFICSRSVLIRQILELWAYGETFSEMIENLKSFRNYNEVNFKHLDCSWSTKIETYCRTYSIQQKNDCRRNFDFLGFVGPVKVNNPDIELCALLSYGLNPTAPIIDCPDIPSYFGRVLGYGGMREELKKYDLKSRMYLGPTSLDHELAFLMANLGLVRPGMMVLDPFVGTGSILVALAHFGAKCTGTDIDSRVLHGEMYAGKGDRTIKRGISENFRIYGLEPPELIRMDNHLFDRHVQSKSKSNGRPLQQEFNEMFDAIVTDPPYGIRAGAKKSGKKDGVPYAISDDRRDDHIPTTQSYPVDEVMLDLLHTAARTLVSGGRLVYLIPTTYDFTVNDLPVHPCLEFVQICEQPLSTRHGRRCVVMEKTRPYTMELEEEYAAYKRVVLSGEDLGFGKLSSKLEIALASSALQKDDVVKNMSKKTLKRKESRASKVKLLLEGKAFWQLNPQDSVIEIDSEANSEHV